MYVCVCMRLWVCVLRCVCMHALVGGYVEVCVCMYVYACACGCVC